ncbi:MAG TPA: adenylosuccinate synthetase [Streptosporangiaceae bacterium]|nr:adenylosuccinate synthetase [Streptosporangiaceae bacterium]
MLAASGRASPAAHDRAVQRRCPGRAQRGHGRRSASHVRAVRVHEWHGFHPYTTWSTTTFANAETLLAEAGMTARRLGVTRCYLTRHGRGPLVTEDPTLELPERHNGRNEWQGQFRVGHFDAVALRGRGGRARGCDRAHPPRYRRAATAAAVQCLPGRRPAG